MEKPLGCNPGGFVQHDIFSRLSLLIFYHILQEMQEFAIMTLLRNILCAR